MKELPFDICGWNDEDKENYEKRINKIKGEKKLLGKDILNILREKLKPEGFLMVSERNYKAENISPFDLAIGDEDDLGMIGFEIKGDSDNFIRLKAQLNHYVFAFDGVYLVLHKKDPPEWLPSFIGVIRVFENGDVFIEKKTSMWDFLDIGSKYDWKALFVSNNMSITSKRTREVLNCIKGIRKNILFNRFFAIQNGFDTCSFKKFYPFTDEQKQVLFGFDIPYNFKLLKKDTDELEKRLFLIKDILNLSKRKIR